MIVREELEKERYRLEERAKALLALFDRLKRDSRRYDRKLDETVEAVVHLVAAEELLALDDVALMATVGDTDKGDRILGRIDGAKIEARIVRLRGGSSVEVPS